MTSTSLQRGKHYRLTDASKGGRLYSRLDVRLPPVNFAQFLADNPDFVERAAPFALTPDAWEVQNRPPVGEKVLLETTPTTRVLRGWLPCTGVGQMAWILLRAKELGSVR